jgi:hypothetical protein
MSWCQTKDFEISLFQAVAQHLPNDHFQRAITPTDVIIVFDWSKVDIG